MNGSSTSAGPRTSTPGPSSGAVVDGRVDEPDPMNSGPKYARRCLAAPPSRRVTAPSGAEALGLGRVAAGDEPHAAQQRLLVAEAEAAVGLVLVVEPLGEVEEPGLVERVAFGDGHAHVEVLTRVAHLREQADVDLRRRRDRSGRAPCAASSLQLAT